MSPPTMSSDEIKTREEERVTGDIELLFGIVDKELRLRLQELQEHTATLENARQEQEAKQQGKEMARAQYMQEVQEKQVVELRLREEQ